MGDKKGPTRAFGATLRELRRQKRLTQDELAEKAGTERSHISALERAEKGPSLGTIFNLAEALGISASKLIEFVQARLPSRRR
jgi:transcriptional regulator with XRE-family HTH domain